MPAFSLSRLAEADPEDIVRFSIRAFGSAVAAKYYASLRRCIEWIALNPAIGRRLEGRTRTFLRYPCRSHVIFYEAGTATVRIVRVLHGRQDAKRAMP